MLDCGGGEEFVFVASSLWAWNASIDAAVAGDRYGWTEMIFSGDLLVVPRYTRCRILDAGFTVSKIRLKDGPYPNQLAWVAPEWLHDPIPEQTAVDYAEMAGNEKSSGGTGLANAAAPEGEACAECSDEVLVAAGAEQEPEGILQKTAGATASLVAKTTDKAITDSKQLAPPQKEEVSAPALAPVGELTPVELVRVIDGDTIVVLRAGEEETVRLFGADCPEEGEDGFNASRAFTLGALSKVRQLYLEFDAVAEYDSYQRTLAWFWLEYKSGTRKLLNIELVHAGYASWETGTQSARYLP
jgi:endonuclease YncB( thermonuclease family)